MITPPLTHQNRHLALPEGPALLAAYQQVLERNTVLEEENAALKQEIRWTAKLLAVPASTMSPSQKVTLYAAAQAMNQQAPDADGLVQIESWNLCQTVGQSKDTFLDNLTYLSENVGVLRKHTQRIVTEDGNYTTNLYIGATDLIPRPDLYRAKKPRNHGGERLLCLHCHSDRLQKKVTITCMSCGSVIDERTSQVNQDEPEQPGIAGKLIAQKRHDADSDPASFFASAESDLTTNRTSIQEGQVAASEQATFEGKQEEQKPASPQ
jgi:hypothetical protein